MIDDRINLIAHLLLIGLSTALLLVFIYMRVIGSYQAIEPNIFIWAVEVIFFITCMLVGIIATARVVQEYLRGRESK
jgi:hypothetical protein